MLTIMSKWKQLAQAFIATPCLLEGDRIDLEAKKALSPFDWSRYMLFIAKATA